jgi:hypothetical protein
LGVVRFMSYKNNSFIQCNFLIEKGEVSTIYIGKDDMSLFFELRIEWR